jgi:glycosyl transferase family 2
VYLIPNPANKDQGLMALRLALAAIFKNEGPYVLEWVAHHRALGIERFFVADNDSTDETTALLIALAQAGIVYHLPFPTPAGRAPQMAAYEVILRRFRAAADWIAFLDADEFLVPAAPHRSLAEVIAKLDPGPDVGAIAVNWSLYGSSGHKQASPRPVAERFIRRAKQNHPLNRHYKSIVRPTAVEGDVENPHYFPLKEGFRVIHPDGSPVADVPGRTGLSTRILWDPIRVNHYVIKSWEEFHHRKRARGRATTDTRRGERFFAGHDLNDVADPMPRWLTTATAAESRRIERVLRKGTGTSPGRPLATWKAQLATLLRHASRGSEGVDAVEIEGDTALVRGAERSHPARSRAAGVSGPGCHLAGSDRDDRRPAAAVPPHRSSRALRWRRSR